MLARGTFVDDLYQIEAIFLYILFAAIQVIVFVPPLPPRVIIYFPIIYCDILFSNILFSISVMKYISYLDFFFFVLGHLWCFMGFPGGSEVKNPSDRQRTHVLSLDQEDPL